MSEKYDIQVKWDSRIHRYIARCKRYPNLIAHGVSRFNARKKMEAAIAEYVSGEVK
jgi:hypothetical protein